MSFYPQANHQSIHKDVNYIANIWLFYNTLSFSICLTLEEIDFFWGGGVKSLSFYEVVIC